MIARLRGRLDAIAGDHVVIDVGGIGYLVFCPARALHAMPAVGAAIDLHIETVVRQDSITLYGFADPVERSWFRLLQTVQGVGARVALAVLGVLPPAELAQAVARQDKAALGRASGVGQRLAARIASELKDRLREFPLEAAVEAAAMPADDAGRDAASALLNLGYGRIEAQAAIGRARQALGQAATVDALIRASLKELASS